MYHIRMNVKGFKDSELLLFAPEAFAILIKHGLVGSCHFFEDPNTSVYIDSSVCEVTSARSVWVFGLDKQIWWGEKLTSLLNDLCKVFNTDQIFSA